MGSAASAAAKSKPALAASAPHLVSHATRPQDEGRENGKAIHDRRIKLIGSISGTRLLRLRHIIRDEYGSTNGQHSCAQLKGGSVDCPCDYCAFFWSRLEEILRRSVA